MSDEQQAENTNPPDEGNAAPAQGRAYTDDDVARILAADREQRGASNEPDDPVARFRASTHGTKLYAAKPKAQPQQPQATSEISELVQLAKAQLALSVAAMKPPEPPKPPKPMTFSEKLQSADETVWLNRGNPNQWTKADREALIQDHARKLQAAGFKGYIEHEAEALASRDIAAAGMKALKNIKISTAGTSIDLQSLYRGGR